MNTLRRSIVAAACLAAWQPATLVFAAGAPASPGDLLSQAADQSQFAFLLFYKQEDPATGAMQKALEAGLAKRAGQAVYAKVAVTDPAARGLVERFGIGRAPLPLTVAVAPNGAMTGIYSRKLTDAHIADALVTPTMADCMQAMQGGKIAVVCVQTSDRAATPKAVEDLLADEEFSDRIRVLSFQATDPAESRFLTEMEIDPTSLQGTTTVLLAPPGVLVGKFKSTASKAEVLAALHEAGKCCDDPNCKHAKGTSPPAGNSAPRQANQAPRGKRK